MTDICRIFNIEMERIIETIQNNDIAFLYDSKDNVYINSMDICKLFMLINVKSIINSQAFNEFIYCIKRNAFGENQYDRINKRILLNM